MTGVLDDLPLDGDPGEFSPQAINQLINAKLTEISKKLDGNPLINPDFRVALGGNGPFTADGAFVDRWHLVGGAGATNAIERVAGLTDDAEFALSWDRTVAGSAPSLLEQRVEDVRALANEQLTFSFDCFSNSGGNINFSVDFAQNFGSGGDPATNTGDVGFIATPGIQRLSGTLIPQSVSGKTIGAGSYLRLRFIRTELQQNGEVIIGRVKIDRGDVSTPYFWRPLAHEVAMAQFYRRRFNAGVQGFSLNANRCDLMAMFEPMRVAPTLSVIDQSVTVYDEAGANTTSAGSTISFTRVTDRGFRILLTGFAGLTAGAFAATDQTSDWLELNSEL